MSEHNLKYIFILYKNIYRIFRFVLIQSDIYIPNIGIKHTYYIYLKIANIHTIYEYSLNT
jgi:hypothetical protein